MNVIGVDVGTTSIRLAIVRFDGPEGNKAHVLASHNEPISTTSPHADYYEQSSKEIWAAICTCCKDCLSSSRIDSNSISAIAFSSTCSLVILDDVPEISNIGEKTDSITNDDQTRDIILWMDHRAVAEASEISATKWKMLRQFGGTCSPEFSLAKIVWLYRKQRHRFQGARGFFELPDWLVYKCLAPDVDAEESPRSLCSVTCKWGYESNGIESRWPLEVLESLGLKSSDGFDKMLGKMVLNSGRRSGFLSHESALQLGLLLDVNNEHRISVGTSLIDAHAGMLAMISARHEQEDICGTFCSLAGTSTCHMLLAPEPLYTDGVWGPYRDVVLDGYYLREAGQSLTGALIEFAIKTHPDGRAKLREFGSMATVVKWLDKRLKHYEARRNGLHITPNFHGNRSPLANPNLRGGIYGLSIGQHPSLDEIYVAVIESLAYETRTIVEKLEVELERVLLSGGLMNNGTFMSTLATVLNCPVLGVRTSSVDLMVIGAALVARSSVSDSPLLVDSVTNIEYDDLTTQTFLPSHDRAELDYHERKYKCFQEFVKFSLQVDTIINSR